MKGLQWAQLLRVDRAVDAGRDRDASCRTSEQRAVSAVAAAHTSRRGAAHLHMRAMSSTCRPSTLVQRRHRTRSRAGRGSPSAPAAERLAHLCSISHPSMASGMESCWKLKLNVPLTGHQVGRLAPELKWCTATVVGRAPIESPHRGMTTRARERYIRVVHDNIRTPYTAVTGLRDRQSDSLCARLNDASCSSLVGIRAAFSVAALSPWPPPWFGVVER